MLGMPRWNLCCYCALILAMGAVPAHAQSVPSSADSGRMTAPTKPNMGAFDVRPTPPPAHTPNTLSPEQAAVTFTLNSMTLHGATAFPEAELQSIYAAKLHSRITVGELYVLVEQIRQRYMDAGYALSNVSLRENTIAQGNIVLDVIEGYVGNVALDTSIDEAPILRSFAAEVKAMHPLNTKRLERLMLILNARPALQVSAVLSAPTTAEAQRGNVTLTLQPKAQLSPRSFVTFDNHGSRFTGPFQLAIGTVIRNLGFNYDDLFLSSSVATQMRELKQGGAEYTLPVLGVSGATLQLSTSVNSAQPGRRLTALEIKGQSRSMTAQASYPVILQRDESWMLNAALTYRNVETNILGSRLFNDQLRVAHASSRYSVSDHWGGLNRLQFEVSKGMNILGARPSGSPDLSRADGRSDFVKTTFSASRLQSITPTIELLANARGQHTKSPLLSSEEFGIGGADTGRGYDPSEITGDRGLSASVELRYNHDMPSLAATLQPYGFYNVGKVWNIDPSDKNHSSIASTGGGVRFYSDDGWNADMVAAIPLTKPADEPPGYATPKSPRFLMSIRKTF